MAVGKDGTVYITWMHCRGKNGGDGSALCPTVHFMLSKSIDGGNTWSAPQRIATVKMPHFWLLPITKERVYNYPAIVVDNSDGPLQLGISTWRCTLDRDLSAGPSDPLDRWRHHLVAACSASPEERHPRSILPLNLSEFDRQSWRELARSPQRSKRYRLSGIRCHLDRRRPKLWRQLATDHRILRPQSQWTENNWMGDYTGNTWAGDKTSSPPGWTAATALTCKK